jgi:pyruvate dehydrogenase E2 component (dihydrolipoamide acetyltransferase)
MTTTAVADIRRTPLRGMRAMIAGAMRKSLDEAAQLSHQGECDVTALLEHKAALDEAGIRVSLEDLLAHGLIRALRRHPLLNGRLEGNEILHYGAVHLSFAMALSETQLVAPALFDAERLSLTELAAARKALVARARAGRLSVSEMTGGTFTLTNLGRSRVRFFTPVINLPQLAILGIGETRRVPVVGADGEIRMRSLMGLSLTFDHRAVDGGPAAAFFDTLCRLLEGEPDEPAQT